MADDPAQQPPEILIQIQAAERKVERMIRSAEQEAAAILDRAQAEAQALVSGKRRTLEERKKTLLAQALKDAEREAERIVQEARRKARNVRSRSTTRMDEAVALVLRRILPS